MFTLITQRLLLRDFQTADFEPFFATTQSPAYQRFYAAEEMTRPFWEMIFGNILAGTNEPDRDAYQLAICQQSDGALIGTCGVRMEDAAHQQASFGCAIGEPYWGHGYALEATRALIDFAFAELPIHRIYAETNWENQSARSLAEKLGFRLEGHLRHYKYFRDRWWDGAIYAILRDDWQA